MTHPGPQDPYGQQYPQQPPNPYGQAYAPQQPAYQGYPPQGPGFQPPYQPQPLPQQSATQHNWAGLTGLILAVLALVCDLTMLLARIGIWMAIAGVLISGFGITKARLGTASNRPLAITGMILSIGAIVLGAVMRSVLRSI
ncbi:hypothetical protein [Nonomuraea pusilla]|uniref:DUF4190 domain-containing protein n=1 Tax=Nonomuraea pusilla TaxID=46177 RepID=A0A1H8K2D2_9ACTN|nr:hypothetical protein [Nonomuraea pusilla]SEN86558.1 hypothetical protein SAMN05660976_08490 [Nonomuraea pusilla]